MRNILIVEDNINHLNLLKRSLLGINKEIQVLEATDINKAYQIALEEHIHLFLVDIILYPQKTNDVAGLKFVQQMREIKKYRFTPVIFITSLEDPKLYSYSQLHCFGYIEKPFSFEKVKKLVLEALEFPVLEEDERYIYFRKDGIVYSKKLQEIIYIESSRRKVIIHCEKDVLEIPYKTCDEILKDLDSQWFVRCSRYTIINIKYIDKIDYVNRYVYLKGAQTTIEIGVVLKKKFKRKVEKIYWK